MDELGLRRLPTDAAVQKTSEILNKIRNKVKQVVIVLAAGAMSENNLAGTSPNIRSEEFTKLKTQLQYELINLTQIFRNSVSISRVAPAGQCLQYSATHSKDEWEPTIGAGDCSTVVGNRPSVCLYLQ